MATAAEETQGNAQVTATEAAPLTGQNDGFKPVFTGGAALVGEALGAGAAGLRTTSGLLSGSAGPVLVLLVAGYAAAMLMSRRRR